MLSFNPNRWLFTTILSVAIVGFITLWVSFHFHWSNFAKGVALLLATSLFSLLGQVVVIDLHDLKRFSRWLPWLLVVSGIGWTISLLIVYPLSRLGEGSFVLGTLDIAAGLKGFAGGGAIGLPPGIFLGLAYWWLTRPYSNSKLLFVNTVLGWFYGTGLAFASFLLLLPFITPPIF